MTIDSTVTYGASAVNFVSNPVRTEWILGGEPKARIALLSSSADGTASTYYWDCTAGKFNWFYGFDETCHLLEGSVTLKNPAGLEQRLVAGDTVFFPMGSSFEWTVDTYVRKLAFCRVPLPWYLVKARDLVRRVKRATGASKDSGGSGLL